MTNGEAPDAMDQQKAEAAERYGFSFTTKKYEARGSK